MIRDDEPPERSSSWRPLTVVLTSASALRGDRAPAWSISSLASPTHFIPGDSTGVGVYSTTITNIGAEATIGSATFIVDLPAGVSLDPTPSAQNLLGPPLAVGGILAINEASNPVGVTCVPGPPVTCTLANPLGPGQRIFVFFAVDVDPSLAGATVTAHMSITGGGAGAAEATEQTPVDVNPAPFGIQALGSYLTAADGTGETLAGGHPYLMNVDFQLNTFHNFNPNQVSVNNSPLATPRHVIATLPHGVVLNPSATPVRCTEKQLTTLGLRCPNASAIGVAHSATGTLGFVDSADTVPIFNMVPPPGAPAEFAIEPLGIGFIVHILGGVDPAGNYSLVGSADDLVQFGGASGVSLDFWGDPSDPSHDQRRGQCGYPAGLDDPPCSVPRSDTPLLTAPTSCAGPLETKIRIDSWEDPGNFISGSAPLTDAQGDPLTMSGCGALDFSPTLQARPTTNVADSSERASVDLHIPQTDSLDQLATAHLKKAVVTLPEGLTLNPSAANGLDACTSSQIGIDPNTGDAQRQPAELPRRLQDRHGRGRHPAARRSPAGLRLSRKAPRQSLRLDARHLPRRRRSPDGRAD